MRNLKYMYALIPFNHVKLFCYQSLMLVKPEADRISNIDIDFLAQQTLNAYVTYKSSIPSQIIDLSEC